MVSLNEINAEADNKYGPFVVDDVPGGDVVLRNIIRLTENEQHRVAELGSKLKDAQAEKDVPGALGIAKRLIEIVAVGDGGTRLLAEIGDDAAKVMLILEMYAEATQMGEASRSGN